MAFQSVLTKHIQTAFEKNKVRVIKSKKFLKINGFNSKCHILYTKDWYFENKERHVYLLDEILYFDIYGKSKKDFLFYCYVMNETWSKKDWILKL